MTTPLETLENLRERLLDLTTRNRLINFRHTRKGGLRVIDELPDQLVETLLDETEMHFQPVPEPSREQLLAAGYILVDEVTGQESSEYPTAEEWAKRCELKTSYEVPEIQTETTDDRHSDAAIQTLLYPHELEARLKNLRQTAESAIQEMGANILYLAFGFLEWFETNGDDPRIAPLMYLDLDPSRWPERANITDHEIVRLFLGGQNTDQGEQEASNGDLGFGEEYPVDDIDKVHEKYPLIDDADSSQHSALIDAIDGKNLVIEGPPGTGKSQTIA